MHRKASKCAMRRSKGKSLLGIDLAVRLKFIQMKIQIISRCQGRTSMAPMSNVVNTKIRFIIDRDLSVFASENNRLWAGAFVSGYTVRS